MKFETYLEEPLERVEGLTPPQAASVRRTTVTQACHEGPRIAPSFTNIFGVAPFAGDDAE